MMEVGSWKVIVGLWRKHLRTEAETEETEILKENYILSHFFPFLEDLSTNSFDLEDTKLLQPQVFHLRSEHIQRLTLSTSSLHFSSRSSSSLLPTASKLLSTTSDRSWRFQFRSSSTSRDVQSTTPGFNPNVPPPNVNVPPPGFHNQGQNQFQQQQQQQQGGYNQNQYQQPPPSGGHAGPPRPLGMHR